MGGMGLRGGSAVGVAPSARPQRFGTQFIRENGRWSLGQVDPRVNDYQRALYGVPPLWYQQQNVDQLQRREEEP